MKKKLFFLSLFVLLFMSCAKEPPHYDGPLPVRPDSSIIEENFSFNSWIEEGFLEISKKTSSAKLRQLQNVCLKKDGFFEVTTQDGRTIENLDSTIKFIEEMKEEDSPYTTVFKETFLPLAKETRKEIDRFLTNDTVLKGLEEKTRPDEMVAHWFRYGYIYAHEPEKVGPLFTKEFRKNIYGNQYSKTGNNVFQSRSIYGYLEELLEIPYELGIEHYENEMTTDELMQRAFIITKNVFGPGMIQKDDQTRIHKENPWDTVFIVWKLENGAWRYDGFDSSNTEGDN